MTVVVADTGIYVSALVFGGVPQIALIQILDPPFSIAVSEEIKAELTGTLTRKFGWPDVRVAEASRHLWANALWCEPVPFKLRAILTTIMSSAARSPHQPR